METRIKKVIKKFLLLFFLSLIYLVLVDLFHIGFVCIFHELTGLECPGCGITRCILSIIKGNFKDAFHYNMLIFILLPFAIMYSVYISYNYIKGKNYYKLGNKGWITLLVVVLLFGIIRNII